MKGNKKKWLDLFGDILLAIIIMIIGGLFISFILQTATPAP